MQSLYKADAVVDLDAASATTAWTMKAPGAGYIEVAEVWGRFEEAVAASGFSSAAGVASLTIGSTEVATWSTGVSATARAIGDTVFFTPATDVKAVNFAAGDSIILKTKTQGTGGTVTGTIRFVIPMELNVG